MTKSQIFPENSYEYQSLSEKDIEVALRKNETITGIVEEISTENEELLIRLGTGVAGHLPFSESTIYPYTYSNNPSRPLPVQICTLLNKKVRVKVTEIKDGTIFLSRKANMAEACEHLKDCSSVLFNITNLIPTMAFGDIGDGINARLTIKEVCKARIKNIAEYFHKGDNIWVNVIGVDEQQRFSLSYKDTFPPYDPNNFRPGDVYVGSVGEAVDTTHTGYYINISPNVTGIMDTTTLTPILRYGDKVECFVSKADKIGLKLKFVRVVK